METKEDIDIEKDAARAELKQLIHDNPQRFEKIQAVTQNLLNSCSTTRVTVAELRRRLRELKAMSDKEIKAKARNKEAR